MRVLHRLVIGCFAAGCATGAVAEPSHAALYSFSDLYRLTVNGALTEPSAIALPGTEPRELRVASVQPEPAELRFTITPVPGPRPWMLLLAGLAAAAWVAHRRLTRPL
jgi:hypothetical protein